MSEVQRRHAEEACAEELAALASADRGPRPPGWALSPAAVRAFLLGTTLADGAVVPPKYIGDPRRIEVAIATLATERALLLEGEPGTGKSWVAEHLAAAICGDSTLLVQGTAGTDEAALRYGWNYARLLSEGPSRAALVESPVLVAMRTGRIARVEELTRIPAEVQDALLTVLSERAVPVPELGIEVQAVRGFNLVATANARDRGVNEPSSALRRRFATVVLPPPASPEEEVRIVRSRLASIGRELGLPAAEPPLDAIRRVVTAFRELRHGRTEDGRAQVRRPSGSLSVADAIAVLSQGWTRATYFGDGTVGPDELADGLVGAAVREPRDATALREYADAILREREGEAAWGAAISARL